MYLFKSFFPPFPPHYWSQAANILKDIKINFKIYMYLNSYCWLQCVSVSYGNLMKTTPCALDSLCQKFQTGRREVLLIWSVFSPFLGFSKGDWGGGISETYRGDLHTSSLLITHILSVLSYMGVY